MDVGEGKTSVSLDGGSFRSLFQMPVPQGNDGAPGGRGIAEDAEWEPQGPDVFSAEGVEGCEAVGDETALLAKEPCRGRGKGCDVSFNQDDLRTGLWGCVTMKAAS